MSALAHLIESRGIATVVVGLVRVHMEKVRPPRGLWVPFELGRPFGEPGDAAFQRRVALAALRLLERTDGPVILEDYPEEAPGRVPAADWTPAIALPPAGGAPADAAGWAAALRAEIARVRPAWEAAKAARGRTTVGVSGVDPAAWPALLASFAAGTPAVESPMPGLRPVQAARYVVDDLKAMYLEAAMAPGDRPSSTQVHDWFWNATLAAAAIQAIRRSCLASDDKTLNLVGGGQFVPGARVPPA
ncbi:MAG: hypothetical protein IPK81_19445 [Rhodospirillales bacterium]|nr:MAG: hypothetical protein IPK81_19445 [Rhodospirillales bacterium]